MVAVLRFWYADFILLILFINFFSLLSGVKTPHLGGLKRYKMI